MKADYARNNTDTFQLLGIAVLSVVENLAARIGKVKTIRAANAQLAGSSLDPRPRTFR